MRAKVITFVVAAIASLGLATPAVAQPACGSTTGQWVGTFTGTHDDGTPLAIRVVPDGASDLAVTTTIDGTSHPPYGDTSITLDRLSWFVEIPTEFWPNHHYGTTSTTCSGGVVRSFSGVAEFFTWPEGWFHWADFQLTRVA